MKVRRETSLGSRSEHPEIEVDSSRDFSDRLNDSLERVAIVKDIEVEHVVILAVNSFVTLYGVGPEHILSVADMFSSRSLSSITFGIS